MTLLSSFSSALIKYLRHKICKPSSFWNCYSDFNAQSIHSLGKNVAINFHNYTKYNKKGDLLILEMSFGLIPIIVFSFTSAQFTQIPRVSIARENQRNDVLNLLNITTMPTPEVEKKCPVQTTRALSRSEMTFPFPSFC